MWLGIGITAMLLTLWGVTEAHALIRKAWPNVLPVTPPATTKSPLCFHGSDASAIETLLANCCDSRLKIDQTDDVGTLTLTVKREGKP